MFENTLNFLGKDASVCSMAFCDNREERGCLINLRRFLWQASVQVSAPQHRVHRAFSLYCSRSSFLQIYQSTNGPQEAGKVLQLPLPNLAVKYFGGWKTEVQHLIFPKKRQLLGRQQVSFMVSYSSREVSVLRKTRVKMRIEWHCLINRL